MQYAKYFLNLSILIVGFGSCKKDTNPLYSIAALTIVNASPNNPSIVATISDTLVPFYVNQSPIAYQSFAEYGNPSGNTPLNLVSAADTSVPLFQGKFNLKPGGIYSLYLVGQIKAIDTVFRQDIIPVYQDSVSGLRFINLVQGSQPISVNLQGYFPTQTEFSGLAYKQISDFKTYSGIGGITSYEFEIRDQSTGNLLTTFSWHFSLYKNNTLVISGSEDPNSTTPTSVFQVNNY
jgi:hypothetical protein